MGRGGKRKGAGRPPNSGHYGKTGSKAKRIPKTIAEIPNVGNHLMEIHECLSSQDRDLAWLAKYCRESGDFDGQRTMQPAVSRRLLYPRYDFAIAASFSISSAIDADDARREEFDPYVEFGEPGQVTFWPVKGDSMIDAGINPGDELVVERIEYPMTFPKTGEIVIARIDDSLTVKTYKAVDGKQFLVPANTTLEPRELVQGEMDVHIYGIVRKLIRTF
jgi:DNA polymerase V